MVGIKREFWATATRFGDRILPFKHLELLCFFGPPRQRTLLGNLAEWLTFFCRGARQIAFNSGDLGPRILSPNLVAVARFSSAIP